ncbi:shikimate dehydrogenase (NADP(+)) [Clostridia bacterium]|nr:shikimate dehydrogenase (NADP(+)) [Clostridia bacterium]
MEELVRERRPLYLSAADLVLPLGCDFCVIGDPIGHTLSPALHSAIFKSVGISSTYGVSNVSRETLDVFTQLTKICGMRGFNVTIPHKQSIIPLLDEVSENAKHANAVNTVCVKNEKLYGYNTDMDGLKMALKAHRNGVGYRDQRILLLGDGGAASGILYKARQDGAEVRVASRKNGGIVDECVRADLSKIDLLINATPLGMLGADKNFADFGFLDFLPKTSLVCDLIYSPLETTLLTEAKKRNLATLNGLTMLVSQALIADTIFFKEDKMA